MGIVVQESQIYGSTLYCLGHGCPLWIPEPNNSLSDEYQESGVRIGDVGILTSDGGFDFVFNVCCSGDDPVNQFGVPQGFRSMNWDGAKRKVSKRFRPGVPILSRGAKTWNIAVGGVLSAPGFPVGAGGGIKIQFNEEKGAVIMPPNGADRTDCQNLAVFREYAKKNSTSWYEFINGTLGREVDSGAIYFITGFDKTDDWENAVIHDESRERGCELIFTTSGLAGDGHLRLSTSSMYMSISSRCSPSGNLYQNQSLFIRGFRIAMRRKVFFNGLGVEVKSTKNLSPEDLFGRKGGDPPFSGSRLASSWSSSATDATSSSTSSRSSPSSPQGSSPASDTSYDTINSENSEELGYQLYHPLNSINRYILESNHEVEVVITHDNDWISLLRDEDIEMPDDSTLVDRLHELLNIKVIDGCAYLDFSRTIQKTDGTVEGSTDEISTKHQWDELPRAHAQTNDNDKSGCWTCRIRRKKCDLERLEGNSCRTCKRLTIECLGWGAKQPEWMRDKQAIDQYKAGIKSRLIQKGLIRGQPRPSINAAHTPDPLFGFSDLSISGPSAFTSHSQQNLLTPGLGVETIVYKGFNSKHMYYFENFRKVHCMMSNHHIMSTTHKLVVQDPRGTLADAISAVSLRLRGVEASDGTIVGAPPPPKPGNKAMPVPTEHPMAKYFYDEAFSQLKQHRGIYTETDVFAALHLICYSQLSGGSTDWQPVLHIALDWIEQLGLPNEDNPATTLGMMSFSTQLSVKCTMMIDIISTITLMQPPRYFELYQRLLCWTGGMQMDILSGCPDEAWLIIAETPGIASRTEESKGDAMGRWARAIINYYSTRFQNTDPSHPQNMYPVNVETPSPDEVQLVIANIFREAALLYLYTVTQGPNPHMPDIRSSVEKIVGMIRQLAPSEIDRLVFPICLAGCMSDNPMDRDFLKGRLQEREKTIGNFMKIRLSMENVWKRRDLSKRPVDWREMMIGMNLLLM